MGVLVVGECLGTRVRRAGPRDRPERQWDETSIVVLDGMKTEQVVVGSVEKFRGTLPEAGEVVALECAVRTFVRSGEPPTAGYGYVGFGRATAVEQALSERVKA